jgi:TorA maturation chaperone TorD
MTAIELENRKTLYGLISRIMITEVDCEFLKLIEENEPLKALLPHYASWDKKSKLQCGELISQYYDADYAHLFLMHLVPYESFYTREDQMIQSGGQSPLMSLYNALDFKVELEKARVVSSDHLGVELEFMHMLCEATNKAYEANDDDGVQELLFIQKGFLDDHLLKWAPMFLINMKKEASTPLYHDAAELALEFLLSDYEYIDSSITKSEQ